MANKLSTYDYELERGKPLPNFNHGAIQATLGIELSVDTRYRVVSELTIDLSEGPYVHTITIFSADGSETTLSEGVAGDPAIGLKADLARVFS